MLTLPILTPSDLIVSTFLNKRRHCILSRQPPSTCSYLYINVLGATQMHIEVDNLWTEASLHLDVHLVAGLHQLFGQVHVITRKAIVSTKSQSARQETH